MSQCLQPGRPPGLSVAVVPQRDRVDVVPEGELDIATIAAVRHKLAALRSGGFERVVLDLRRLSFVDSCAIHLLFELESAAARDGIALSVRLGTATPARRLFALAGLEQRFAVA